MTGQIVRTDNQLPANIPELQKFIIVSRAKLDAVRTLIHAIDKLPLAKEVREQKKEEAQLLAGALLDAEARMGELLKAEPLQGTERSKGYSTDRIPTLKKYGLTAKQSHYFRQLADHPDIIEQVKEDAKRDDDLPTRTEVLRRIKEQEARPKEGYWLIPPEIYEPLNKEFHFTFDPCPNPRPEHFDGLTVDWRESNWVNPPFWAGITAWVKKAVEEQQKGNTSVLILPLDSWVGKLVESGAEIRPLGFHDWIHSTTNHVAKPHAPHFSSFYEVKEIHELNKIRS